MNHIEKLDYVLELLYNDSKLIYSQELHTKVVGTLEKDDLSRIINYLSENNYIEKIIENRQNNTKIRPPFFCRITYEGVLFFEKGGFNNANKTLRLNHNWKIAKTIANTANAIIIVVIAIIGIYISTESNKKDDLLKENQTKIDSLKNELKIIHLKTEE